MMKNYELLIHDKNTEDASQKVDVVGCLDSHTVVEFEKTIQDVLITPPNHLVLDLSKLTYISSAGISALMGLTYKLRKDHSELILLKPSEKVYRVFRTLGFTSIFKIVEDEDALGEAISN
ncbi:MAG: STAS domain-containing protein [Sumerlaeia bacterium]